MAQITRIDPQAKQKKEKLRVAAYCRVSSNSADQLNSYTRQINTYKAMIAKKPDWTLVEIFADEGITGTSAEKRTEFLRMIKLCELKQIDLIITKSVSRFARNVKEALEYVRKLKLLGVGVMFEKEGINTCSLADEMLLNTFAAIAQEESTSISQNLRMANLKRMADGSYSNGSAPYGLVFENSTFKVYEPEAAIVREVFDRYLSGWSTLKIAENLKARQIPTRSGKFNWTETHICNIIKNEKYVGDTMCQKYYTTDFPFKLKVNKGEKDKYYTVNTHEGIVTREAFEAANELMKRNSAKYASKKERTVHPFSEMFRCAECGGMISRKNSKGRERWCCRNHFNGGDCNAHYLQTYRIEDGFITIINNLRFGSDILGQAERYLIYAIQQFRINDENSQSINGEIAELNGQILMLEQLNAKGYLEAEVYQIRYRDLAKRISELKSKKSLSSLALLEDTLKKLRELKSILFAINDPVTSFDEALFKETVVSGTISADDELTLEFIGGIKITEKI